MHSSWSEGEVFNIVYTLRIRLAVDFPIHQVPFFCLFAYWVFVLTGSHILKGNDDIMEVWFYAL